MKPTLKQILKAVAQYYNVEQDCLFSKYTVKAEYNRRAVFCYICLDIYSYSPTVIAQFIGYSGRDATLHAANKIRKLDDATIKNDIAEILKQLKVIEDLTHAVAIIDPDDNLPMIKARASRPGNVVVTAAEKKIMEQKKLMDEAVLAFKRHQDAYGTSTHSERHAWQKFNDVMQKMTAFCGGV